MQFSTILISVAALISSALACMNVSVVYTRETQFEQNNLFISYLDNGRITCYYNQTTPDPEKDTQVPLASNPGKDVVNDTVQGCVHGYESRVRLDLKSDSDKEKHNYIDFYRYTPDGIHSVTTSYNKQFLGTRNDEEGSWSWTTALFC
ncbi:uncharacterized protein EAF01_008010 [Botrytis porri]|uniref:AA1-like domain-containing protein n=1 Tax=Botrytis porri TaxID=87229 RepID=A0A4Z1KED7_9HELO|nr:uncharacterized protein EAF01_008010 [Botrytis porri]KAF7900708.1 hypothetical protein EAF01_008010 [Botrytis porri]TGO83798.1 hypothetical protein BPOR_0591g00020 [Botrytis porri]